MTVRWLRQSFLCNRRRLTTLGGLLSTVNFAIAAMILLFIVLKHETKTNGRTLEDSKVHTNYMGMDSRSSRRKANNNNGTFSKNNQYDYYFRIDYTIKQTSCQSLTIFHSITVKDTIQNMTTEEINGILTNGVKIDLDVLRIHTILQSSKRVVSKNWTWPLGKANKFMCSYILELFVGMNFLSQCNDQCQSSTLTTLTSSKNVFGDLPNSSLKLSLTSTSQKMPIFFYVENVSIFRTAKYLEKALFIQSVSNGLYLSTKLFRRNDNQSFISMSASDKSLFIMRKGLCPLDSTSVYVSFLSLSSPNVYIRHQDARIKLSKNDESTLFQQDATFKLNFDNKNDVVIFETINLSKRYFVASNSEKDLGLISIKGKQKLEINDFDTHFKFMLIPVS